MRGTLKLLFNPPAAELVGTNQVVKGNARLMSFALVVAVLLILATTANAQPYQIINNQSSTVGNNLTKTVITVQEGTNQLDRFQISKVRKTVPDQPLKGVILLLPPGGSGFQNYEVGENGDYNNSFVAFFAQHNYLVVGYSQRVHGLAAGACESGQIDCSPMANWGLQTIVDDVTFIREQVGLAFPNLKVVLTGLSLGSISSMALLNVHPGDYAGAVLIDGSIYDEDETVRAIGSNFCSTFEGLLAGGSYYDGQSGPGIKAMSQLAQLDPNSPTPIPGFPPGTTNRQAFILAMTAPPLSPLSPLPGFYNLHGSVAQNGFTYADEALVHASIAAFENYTPTKTMRDLTCGLAGESTFTNNLGSFTGPVLMFGAGHGFGSPMLDTADLMTSAKVKVLYNEDYGHVDHVFSTNHRQHLEKRILKWLKKSI